MITQNTLLQFGSNVFLRLKNGSGVIATIVDENEKFLELKKASYVEWTSMVEIVGKGHVNNAFDMGDMGIDTELVLDYFPWKFALPFDIPTATSKKLKKVQKNIIKNPKR